MSDHLLRALCEMLPDADVDLVSQRPSHSLMFSGLQLTIEVTLSGNDSDVVGKFTFELSEQDFDLPGLLVADIAVTNQIEDGNHIHLTIDALLLDD